MLDIKILFNTNNINHGLERKLSYAKKEQYQSGKLNLEELMIFIIDIR